jgi:alkylated DNA repair dioxygenase AlkB
MFLFPLEPDAPVAPAIPGLAYLPDYITPAEEADLVAAIDAQSWDATWDRRRQPYGATYGKNDPTPPPIPSWAQPLITRLHQQRLSITSPNLPPAYGLQPTASLPTALPLFNQMLVNEYMPGQGIALHRDYEPFDRTVVSLSLLAPVVMDFRHAADGRRKSLLLEPRSLLILSDEARYDWQHGIARRKNDRWQGQRIPRARRLSVTFRLFKQTP